MSDITYFNQTLHLWSEAAMHTSMQAFRQHNRTSGLSFSQVTTLFRIYHHGPASVNDLAEHLGVTKAAVSQLLDKLVADELILRLEDPRDRRSKQILLTEKGRETVRISMQVRHAWIDELAEALSPEDKAAIQPALERLIACFREIRDNDLVTHIQKEITS